MAGHGAKLGRKQDEAIAALLSQPNVDQAARVTGIGARTLWRWMKEPEFDAAYRAAKRAAFGQSIARLQQASGAAVATLLKIMVDTNAPASTRVRAADSVLDHSANAIELEGKTLTNAKEAREEVEAGTLFARLLAVHADTHDILRDAKQSRNHVVALQAIGRIEKQLELEASLIGELDNSTKIAVGVQVNAGTEPAWDLSKLTLQELMQLEALEKKACNGNKVIDA